MPTLAETLDNLVEAEMLASPSGDYLHYFLPPFGQDGRPANPGFWFAGPENVNLSGVVNWSTGGVDRSGALVTARHVLCAAANALQVGEFVRFYKQDGSSYAQRKVIATQAVPDSLLQVAYLDAVVPDVYARYRVLGDYDGELAVLGRLLLLTTAETELIAVAVDNEPTAGTDEITWSAAGLPALGGPYYAAPGADERSNPGFLYAGEEYGLVLVAVQHDPTTGSFPPLLIDAINTVLTGMDDDSAGRQLQTVSAAEIAATLLGSSVSESDSASESESENEPVVVPPLPDCSDSELGEDDCERLQDNCGEWVFGRVRVRNTIAHGAWIEWQLHPQFSDPGPHEYQLQVGHTGSNLADDWTNVGLPAENVCHLLDDEQRIFGQTQWTHYRVCLTTPNGTYFSPPQHTWGDLPTRYHRLWINRDRMYRLAFQRTRKGQPGYLLKRRLTGDRPQLGQGVLDFITEEILNPESTTTFGTEYLGGYYAPIPNVYADLSRVARREHLDGGQARGTVNDEMRVTATMLAVPQIDSYDVWIAADSDFRWVVHRVEHLEEIMGVPVVLSVEMRLLPYTHVAYKIPVPNQLPA